MEMDVTLLFFSMADKKAVSHTSNDPDFGIPEVNVLTKLWFKWFIQGKWKLCNFQACGGYCKVGFEQIYISFLNKHLGHNTFCFIFKDALI